jgi:hypothetical protein
VPRARYQLNQAGWVVAVFDFAVCDGRSSPTEELRAVSVRVCSQR